MAFQNSDDSFEVEGGRISLEDDVSRMNTEDSLLSSKASSVNINKSGVVACCAERDIHRKCWNPKSKIVIGTLLTIWGVATLIWTPFDILLDEKLRMRPGLPPFEWWKTPPDEVRLSVYVFNITNVDRFLSGEDSKLNLQEIGPIVYLEKLTHTNVSFNDNGTMTFVATRRAIYLPDENTIDINQTINVVNFPVLGMASYFWDASFIEKIGFNMMVSASNANVTKEITIYDYLWNYSDPITELGRKIVPYMVPIDNFGVLATMYADFTDTNTVNIGLEHGHKNFFLMDKYDGTEYLPGHGDKCEDQVTNSTEGVFYSHYLTKDTVIRYWRKSICFVMPLHFQYESRMYGVDIYKYVVTNDSYDRTQPEEKDCYKGDPILPDGLIDVSLCYWNFPIAASFPHFLHGDPKLSEYVDGLHPDEAEHESYVLVEPTVGIPTRSRARSQSNLVLRTLEGFNSDIERFSELVIPMFWADYHQVGLPWYIVATLYFTINVLPIFQRVWTAILFIAAVFLITSGSKQHANTKRNYLLKNKVLQYEQQGFLKV